MGVESMRTILLLAALIFAAEFSFAGLPPTSSKVSTDASNVTTFNYQFPNFTGTHTGITLSLGINSIAGGGTGQTTANAGFAALAPLTTNGDLTIQAGGVPARLGIGTTGQLLTVVSGLPTWQTQSPYAVQTINSTTSAVAGITYNCNTSGGAFTVTLPPPVINTFIVIKDSTGSFGTNALTLAPHGSEMIEGLAANKVFQSNWGSWSIYADGTNWFLGAF